MPVTLRDVALDAGVSVRTVSNVVSGFPNVATTTRDHVQASVRKLGYRPNLIARNLRQGRTGLIGLALPELNVPYFSDLAQSIMHFARANDLTVVVEQTYGDPALEHDLLSHGGRGMLFDGLIFSPLTLTSAEVAEIAGSMPVVLLGEREATHRFDHVAIDNIAAARVATDHLIGLGHKRIAAIGYQPDEKLRTSALRARGYETALASAGMPLDPDLTIVTERFHRADGAAAARRLLALPDPPDAVFCFNDLLALGALREALETGRKVPRDLAIVGFDDIEDGRYATPSLSTVRPRKDQIARLAVEMLVARLDGDPSRPREHVAEFDLAIRESTTGRRRKRGSPSPAR